MAGLVELDSLEILVIVDNEYEVDHHEVKLS